MEMMEKISMRNYSNSLNDVVVEKSKLRQNDAILFDKLSK